jgi:hypothetical protein
LVRPAPEASVLESTLDIPAGVRIVSGLTQKTKRPSLTARAFVTPETLSSAARILLRMLLELGLALLRAEAVLLAIVL